MSPTLLELLVIALLLALIAAYGWTLYWSLRQQRIRTAYDDQAPSLPPANEGADDLMPPMRNQGDSERVH